MTSVRREATHGGELRRTAETPPSRLIAPSFRRLIVSSPHRFVTSSLRHLIASSPCRFVALSPRHRTRAARKKRESASHGFRRLAPNRPARKRDPVARVEPANRGWLCRAHRPRRGPRIGPGRCVRPRGSAHRDPTAARGSERSARARRDSACRQRAQSASPLACAATLGSCRQQRSQRASGVRATATAI